MGVQIAARRRLSMTARRSPPTTSFSLTSARGTCRTAQGTFLQYLKHVTKTVAVDPLTVVVETDGPDPILLNELQNVWIVSTRDDLAGDRGLQLGQGGDRHRARSLAEWVPGDHITLRRSEGYYGAKPDWEQVTYRAITNDAARTAALLSGDVDLIASVPGNDLDRGARQPEADRLHHAEQPVLFLECRCRSRRLAAGDRHRRQADVGKPI